MTDECDSEDLYIKCLFVDYINGVPIPAPCPQKITVGASSANVIRVPTTTGRSYWYSVQLFGISIGSTIGGRLGESWRFKLTFSASSPVGGGSVALPPTVYQASTHPVPTVAVTWMVVGANFELDVVGQAGYTIRWQCQIEQHTDIPP